MYFVLLITFEHDGNQETVKQTVLITSGCLYLRRMNYVEQPVQMLLVQGKFKLCSWHADAGIVSVRVYNNNTEMMANRTPVTLCTYLLLLLAALSILAGCAGSGAKRASQPAIAIDPRQRTEVVLTALALLESQYQYGGSHPTRGFDCSGLVAYVFNNAARQALPHNTAEIAHLSRPISRKQLKAGDFVFFNTLNRSFSHMGIYIGEGRFINAPSSGGQVRIDTLTNPYYAKRFEAARTLFGS